MPLKATSNSRLATTAFVGGILAFRFGCARIAGFRLHS
jgi:hypothetical protein